MQIIDTQKFKLTADPEDSAGFDVEVAVAFSIPDGDATVTLEDVLLDDGVTPDPKSKWIVAGTPGSTVVTVLVRPADGSADLTATLAVDVVTGGVATIALVSGDPVDK